MGAHAVSWMLGLWEGLCVSDQTHALSLVVRGLGSWGLGAIPCTSSTLSGVCPAGSALDLAWGLGLGAQEHGSLWGSDGLVLLETHELSCHTLGQEQGRHSLSLGAAGSLFRLQL